MTASLPQKDTVPDQIERGLELSLAQGIYKYKTVEGLPMPLVSDDAAFLQVLGLKDWVKGQLENQLRIFVNLKIWELLSKYQGDDAGIEDYADKIAEVVNSSRYAVNFPQIDYWVFIPNFPAAIYTPPPNNFKTASVDIADLLALLPPATQTGVQVKTTFTLAGYHYAKLLDYYLTVFFTRQYSEQYKCLVWFVYSYFKAVLIRSLSN